MRLRQVVVIGSSDASEYLEESYEIGRYIARNGWALITGGRGGVMEAASRGASVEEGVVVGVIPDTAFSGANSYCTIVIPTGIGFARNVINALSGDVIIAIGGKYGTLSELAFARQYRKPIICCTFAGGWGETFYRHSSEEDPGYPLFQAGSVGDVCARLDTLLK